MAENVGYQLEHCKNCHKAVRDWHPLKEKLENALDTLNLPEKLEEKFNRVLYHHMPKINFAGCPNGCSQPQIKDFGVIGYVTPQVTNEPCITCRACEEVCMEDAVTVDSHGVSINYDMCVSCGDCIRPCPTGSLAPGESGWELLMGGRVGRHPRFAVPAGKATTDEKVVDWIVATLEDYIKNGQFKERLANYLERTQDDK